MSNYGFVYIMSNEGMENVFKLGCTERSPHARAAELSAPTGVPSPFKVVCYMEITDFQAEEKVLHKYLDDYRVSANREFFEIQALERAFAAMYWHPRKLSFCTTEVIYDHDIAMADWNGLPSPWGDKKSNVVPISSAQAEATAA